MFDIDLEQACCLPAFYICKGYAIATVGVVQSLGKQKVPLKRPISMELSSAEKYSSSQRVDIVWKKFVRTIIFVRMGRK
jgi:hypothetical protein